MCSNDFAPDYPNMLIGTIAFYVSFLDVQLMFFQRKDIIMPQV